MSKASDFAEAASKLKYTFEHEGKEFGFIRITEKGQLAMEVNCRMNHVAALAMANWIYENFGEKAEVSELKLVNKEGELK